MDNITGLKYIQVVDIFRQAAKKHLAVSEFYYGAPWENTQRKDCVYPSVFFEINNLVTVTPSQKVYNIAFYVLDKNQESIAGERSIIEAVPKLLTRTEDIAHQMMFSTMKELSKLRILNWTLTPILEEFNDRVWGHRVETTITIPIDYSYCLIPYDDLEYQDNYGCTI